jgi:predicted permease
VYPQPPYVLLIAGFLAAIAAGSAFSASLQQATHAWAKNPAAGSLEDIRGFSLQLPYLGICIGICICLASGIQLFGYSAAIAYAMSGVMTALMALLVWRQLGVILAQLQEGGSKALDLDAF